MEKRIRSTPVMKPAAMHVMPVGLTGPTPGCRYEEALAVTATPPPARGSGNLRVAAAVAEDVRGLTKRATTSHCAATARIYVVTAATTD